MAVDGARLMAVEHSGPTPLQFWSFILKAV
jgi:hypothetical protein